MDVILLLLIPLLGALCILLLPAAQQALIRPLALFSATLTLLYTLYLYTLIDFSSPQIQVYSQHAWNMVLGTYFSFGIDGLSYPLLLLGNLLTLVALGISASIQQHVKAYYSLILLLSTATMGVFTAQGWALFYVFWELVLIPLFFLIDRWGGARRQTAALNFVLYTLGGSVFLLLGLLVMFDANPAHNFLFSSMREAATLLSTQEQTLIFLGLLLGFGVKMPIFPLHGWLPLAYGEAPSPVAVLLAGILSKMGAYGLLRSMDMLPRAAENLQSLLMALGVIGLLYGGLLAWRQSDLKKMVAYAAISHMGVIMIGMASLNHYGLSGAVLQMVAHGLVAATLFLLVSLLQARTGTYQVQQCGNLLESCPRFAVLMVLALAGGMSAPGTGNFIGELHVLVGSFQTWGWWLFPLLLGMLITATYSLRTIKELFTGTVNTALQPMQDLNARETLAAGVLIASMLVIGIYPAPLLAMVWVAIEQLAGRLGGV